MDTLLRNIAARAATPARYLIVLGMAYTLASTVLFVAAPPEAASVSPRNSVERLSRDDRPGADLDSIVGANLFGVAGAKPSEAAAEAARESLAETRLPLVLHGVFVAETPGDSTAILARKGRSEQLYHIGERVPGNATLDTVYIDHVLLRRGRSLERLTFPKSDETIATPATRAKPRQAGATEASTRTARIGSPATAVPSARTAGERSPGEMAQQVREKLKADPQKALGELGLSPVGGDAPAGYRLDRLAQSPYLRQTGLKPGDVILSINGQPVGDVGRDRLELDNVLAQGSARLEVQRGERRFFITASLR